MQQISASDLAYVQQWETTLETLLGAGNANAISGFNTAVKDAAKNATAPPTPPFIVKVDAEKLLELCSAYIIAEAAAGGLSSVPLPDVMSAASLVKYVPPPPPPAPAVDPTIRVGGYMGNGNFGVAPGAHVTDGEKYSQNGLTYVGHVISSPFNPAGGTQYWSIA